MYRDKRVRLPTFDHDKPQPCVHEAAVSAQREARRRLRRPATKHGRDA